MRHELRLNCNGCGTFEDYDRGEGDPKTVVRCGGCGKRHSTDSVWMVDTSQSYERDEVGNLLETPI